MKSAYKNDKAPAVARTRWLGFFGAVAGVAAGAVSYQYLSSPEKPGAPVGTQARVSNPIARSGSSTDGAAGPPASPAPAVPAVDATAVEADRQDDIGAMAHVENPIERSAGSSGDWKRDLAERMDEFGQSQESLGDFAKALPPYRRALVFYEELLTQSPNDPLLTSLAADVSFHLGRALSRQNPPDTPGAREALERSHAWLGSLEKSNVKLTKDQLATRNGVESALKVLPK